MHVVATEMADSRLSGAENVVVILLVAPCPISMIARPSHKGRTRRRPFDSQRKSGFVAFLWERTEEYCRGRVRVFLRQGNPRCPILIFSDGSSHQRDHD